jgi:hypothetical protein
VAAIVLISTVSAMAEWKAANPEVAAAATDPKIASVLGAVNVIDAALIKDGHAAFAALLAKDLVVNNRRIAFRSGGRPGEETLHG